MGRASRNKQTMPCIARNTDGTRCGRRIPIGSSPQLCHIHATAASGGNIGTPFEPADLDPVDVLKKDMRASEASVRVRAATELLAEERRRRAEREHVSADDRAWKVFVAEATADERADMLSLARQVSLIKHRIYQRCPEARPANYHAPIVIARSDLAPGTLYLHENGTICEAGEWQVPSPAPVASEDHKVVAGRTYYPTAEALIAAEPDAMVIEQDEHGFFVEASFDEDDQAN